VWIRLDKGTANVVLALTIRFTFRIGRQPPTIVTWPELHFYDSPLIRPSGTVRR
jgi:hypothetical protein